MPSSLAHHTNITVYDAQISYLRQEMEHIPSKMADLESKAFVLGELNEQDREVVVTGHSFHLMVEPP